jgi:hypothetical protein
VNQLFTGEKSRTISFLYCNAKRKTSKLSFPNLIFPLNKKFFDKEKWSGRSNFKVRF